MGKALEVFGQLAKQSFGSTALGAGGGAQSWQPSGFLCPRPSLGRAVWVGGQLPLRACRASMVPGLGTSWGVLHSLSKDGGRKYLSWIFQCPGACSYMIIGFFSFFPRYKGLKRLQRDDEEATPSAHKGTLILGAGDRRGSRGFYSVLSLVFLWQPIQ